MGAKVVDGKGKKRVQQFHKRPKVPPPESSVWPEEYRGQKWKPVYAFFFAGKCQLCAYSFAQPRSLRMRDKLRGWTRLLMCINHPSCPGGLKEMLPTETCRNFKQKVWKPARHKRVVGDLNPTYDQSDPTIRRISVGNGLFAIVDVADYEWLSKYKWHVQRSGRTAYAFCRKGNKTVSMHRMITRPRRGYVVDHLDHNGLNNRRGNLHVCLQGENASNTRSHGGKSGFVGVTYTRGRWRGGVTFHGKYHCAGQFRDPVEAAKARDRLAYGLLPYAYLNFPEDFPAQGAKRKKKAVRAERGCGEATCPRERRHGTQGVRMRTTWGWRRRSR